MEKWHQKWKESTGDLEKFWLKRSTYLAGEQLTTADLLGVCEMMQPIATGYDVDPKAFPRVVQWMERVKKDTAPYFEESHAIIMRVRKAK